MNRRAAIGTIAGLALGPAAAEAAAAPGAPAAHRFTRATIHHTVTPADRPADRVRAIDAYHRSLGWDGIGYHVLVGADGGLWFGRPLDRDGAHVRGENAGNLGLAFIGDFSSGRPAEAALQTARAFLALAQAAYGFGPEAVFFHKELARTACPGDWDKRLLVGGES